MNYLSVENLSKSYDERLLFENITFGLDQGQKVALVGVNGCGKSTLLKIIAGLEKSDRGIVSFRKGLQINVLSQNPHFHEDETVWEAVFDPNIPELKAVKDYEYALFHAEKAGNSSALHQAIEQLDRLQAWDFESQVKQILGKLGIHDFDQKIATLSGGQRKRVALARVLVTKPDVIILDEPTNHLDLDIIEWLEEYLSRSSLTLLMVTHDRYFLDRVTHEIFEMDGGKLYKYKGNYTAFLDQKTTRLEQEKLAQEKAQNLLRKELEWMRRQPKARGTKAKYRIDAFYDLQERANKSRQDQEIEINLQTDRQGKKIMILEQVSKKYDQKILIHHFNHTFQRKERVGIVGPNGAGKSTLLQLLNGDIRPDTGKIDRGGTITIGFYTQEEENFDPNQRVIDCIQEIAEVIKLSNGSEVTASQLLNQFLFPPKMQQNKVGKLSGGEKRRLQLLRVLMKNPNFLILDEPTNDLDLVTMHILEEYLSSFEGSLVIVSHDRYFMDNLVDHLFVFEGEGKIKDFPGNYTDWRIATDSIEKPVIETKSEKPKIEKPIQTDSIQRKKLSFKESQELAQLEIELPKLELKLHEKTHAITTMMAFDKIQVISQEIEMLQNEIAEKEMRWLSLSERA